MGFAANRNTPAIPRTYFGAWVFVVAVLCCYAWRMVGIGLDLRQDFWVYCAQNHMPGDMNNALDQGNLVLREAQDVAQEDAAERNSRGSGRKTRVKSPPAIRPPPSPGLDRDCLIHR